MENIIKTSFIILMFILSGCTVNHNDSRVVGSYTIKATINSDSNTRVDVNNNIINWVKEDSLYVVQIDDNGQFEQRIIPFAIDSLSISDDGKSANFIGESLDMNSKYLAFTATEALFVGNGKLLIRTGPLLQEYSNDNSCVEDMWFMSSNIFTTSTNLFSELKFTNNQSILNLELSLRSDVETSYVIDSVKFISPVECFSDELIIDSQGSVSSSSGKCSNELTLLLPPNSILNKESNFIAKIPFWWNPDITTIDGDFEVDIYLEGGYMTMVSFPASVLHSGGYYDRGEPLEFSNPIKIEEEGGSGEGNEDYLSVSPFQNYQLKAQGGSLELTVLSNTYWYINSPASWLDISSRWNSQNKVITIDVLPNLTCMTRESVVVLETRYGNSADKIEYEFNIQQDGAELKITPVSPQMIEAQGGRIRASTTLDVPIEWKVAATNGGIEWLRLNGPEEMRGNANFDIVVLPNDSYIERESQIIIQLIDCNDKSSSFDVIQQANLPIIEMIGYYDLEATHIILEGYISHLGDPMCDFVGFQIVTDQNELIYHYYTSNFEPGYYALKFEDISLAEDKLILGADYTITAFAGRYTDNEKTFSKTEIVYSNNYIEFTMPNDIMVGTWTINRYFYDQSIDNVKAYEFELYEDGTSNIIVDDNVATWTNINHKFTLNGKEWFNFSGTVSRSIMSVSGTGQERVIVVDENDIPTGETFIADLQFYMYRGEYGDDPVKNAHIARSRRNIQIVSQDVLEAPKSLSVKAPIKQTNTKLNGKEFSGTITSGKQSKTTASKLLY